MSNRLFVFEGLECVGKSSVIKGLAAQLEALDHEVVVVKVPGGTDVGLMIREIIVGENHLKMSHTANALLFCADWVHSLETVIIPALERGAIVLADRSNISTYAYQYKAHHLDDILNIADSMCKPHRVFILNADYKAYAERVAGRASNNARDIIDEETFNSYQQRYIKYHSEHDNAHWVPTDVSLELVTETIATYILDSL